MNEMNTAQTIDAIDRRRRRRQQGKQALINHILVNLNLQKHVNGGEKF